MKIIQTYLQSKHIKKLQKNDNYGRKRKKKSKKRNETTAMEALPGNSITLNAGIK
jgi:hypothetical protein